jgi:hypothetical protein
MTDEDIAFSALIAVGLSAADIVEDPLPLASLHGGAPDPSLQATQPMLAELIVAVENEAFLPGANVDEPDPGVNLATHGADILCVPPSNSDNYATALVDSPFDAEWLFTTTASPT